MTDPINQEHEDVLNFAHSLPSGLTKEQIYVRIHERARAIPPAAAAAGLPAGWKAVPEVPTGDMCRVVYEYANDAGEMPEPHIVWNEMLAVSPALPADPVDESQPAALSETQQYRTGYGDGVRRAAKVCEAIGAHTLAGEIRNLQSTAPVVAPVPAASEGWTENTGEQPVGKFERVEVMLRDGEKEISPAGLFVWSLDGDKDDIVCWRPAAPATSDKAEG